jgi:hypothetical protein
MMRKHVIQQACFRGAGVGTDFEAHAEKTWRDEYSSMVLSRVHIILRRANRDRQLHFRCSHDALASSSDIIFCQEPRLIDESKPGKAVCVCANACKRILTTGVCDEHIMIVRAVPMVAQCPLISIGACATPSIPLPLVNQIKSFRSLVTHGAGDLAPPAVATCTTDLTR